MLKINSSWGSAVVMMTDVDSKAGRAVADLKSHSTNDKSCLLPSNTFSGVPHASEIDDFSYFLDGIRR